jgi:hypothetical protein
MSPEQLVERPEVAVGKLTTDRLRIVKDIHRSLGEASDAKRPIQELAQ